MGTKSLSQIPPKSFGIIGGCVAEFSFEIFLNVLFRFVVFKPRLGVETVPDPVGLDFLDQRFTVVQVDVDSRPSQGVIFLVHGMTVAFEWTSLWLYEVSIRTIVL